MNTGRRDNRDGFTMVEVMVVMVIIVVLSAMVIPSLSGFLDRAKEKRYVIEANSVYAAVQVYAMEEYANGRLNSIYLYKDLTTSSLDTPDNPLYEYLRVNCTEHARIDGVTVDEDTAQILEIVYLVKEYEIVIGEEGTEVKKINK